MPALPSALYERFGLNAYVQGDFAKALSWFRKLERREPDSLRVLRNLGVILLAMGDASGADDCLRREERLYGETAERHLALADVAWARGDRAEAGRRYAAALADREPASGRRGAEALARARLAVCGDEPAFARTRVGAARFAEAQEARERGDWRSALELYAEAAELDPTNWPAMNNAGAIALNDAREPARALEFFRRALALSPAPQTARNAELAAGELAKADRSKRRGGAR